MKLLLADQPSFRFWRQCWSVRQMQPSAETVVKIVLAGRTSDIASKADSRESDSVMESLHCCSIELGEEWSYEGICLLSYLDCCFSLLVVERSKAEQSTECL